MKSAKCLCIILAASVTVYGFARAQPQDCLQCQFDNCSGMGIYHPPNLENTICSINTEYLFNTFESINMTMTGRSSFGSNESQQNVYVVPQFTFPCSGHIQGVEIRAMGDMSLQAVLMDIYLWRIQSNGGSLLFQQTANFTVRFSSLQQKTLASDSREFLLQSESIPESEQPHFESGDVLGFSLPANSSIQVSTEFEIESDNNVYLITESPTSCTFIKKLEAEPLIAIRVAQPPTPFSILPSILQSTTSSYSASQPFSIPQPTKALGYRSDGSSRFTESPTPSTSPTFRGSPSPLNMEFVVILGAALGGVLCVLLAVTVVILVICGVQRHMQPTKWTRSKDFKASLSTANPLSIVRSTRLERLASTRHQHTGIVNTAAFGCKDEDDYDIPTELLAQFPTHNTQDVENAHFYHVLESPSPPPLPASPPRPDLVESPSTSSVDSQGKYLTMYPPGSTPASTRREILPTHPEEEETNFIGYHAPAELETHVLRRNKPEDEVENTFYQFIGHGSGEHTVEYDLPVELMRMPHQEMVVSEPTKHVYHELENPEEGITAKQPFYHELEGPTPPEATMEEKGGTQALGHYYHTLEPTVVDEVTGHPYHTLESSSSENGNNRSLGSHQIFEFGIYVPDAEERQRLTGGRGELIPTNIYDVWSKKKRQDSTKQRAFFEQTSAYWKPSDLASGLYDQLSQKKFREILRDQIVIEEFLGSGQYGSVSRAAWRFPSGVKKVAVKVMRPSAADNARVKFLQEAAIMGQFFHSNVARLYGVVTVGEPAMIVLELMPLGDVATYLKKNHKPGEMPPPSPQTLLSFCRQVACGMGYLARKGFIHRDLAARNVLLNESLVCKICDFGMSRDLEDSVYYISRGGNVPIKWTAPEALVYKKYSTASDVYSYGMLLYEIWSLGLKPLANFRIAEVPKKTSMGYCQPPPPGCPREIYQLMVKCWNPVYNDRPTFAAVVDLLNAPDETLLKWSEEDRSVSDRAAELGSPLTESSELYRDLQLIYQLD